LRILESEAELTEDDSRIQREEKSDEFLRNFFIKFGMKKTLDSFQQEWFEFKAKGELDLSLRPAIPIIYKENQELTDEVSAL
jgi:hypothetical protein